VVADDRLPAARRDRLRRRRELTAGVVHEDRRTPELLPDGVDERGDLLGLTDVARHREDVARAAPAELGLRRRQLLRLAPADGDLGAELGEHARGRETDTAASAGDDGDVPVEQSLAEDARHGSASRDADD